ncbi:MAG: hypothetical protein WDZ61_00540 [Parcubacteria group bacterium]
MEYRHNPPSLEALRKLRKELGQAPAGKPEQKKKKGIFSSSTLPTKEELTEELNTLKDAQDLLLYEQEVILAHLENQNELILELVRKIDRK